MANLPSWMWIWCRCSGGETAVGNLQSAVLYLFFYPEKKCTGVPPALKRGMCLANVKSRKGLNVNSSV